MTIGVDAGALSTSDTRLETGVWRVSFELLKALSSIDRRKCSYTLFSFKPIPERIMAQLGKNMENVVLSPSNGYMKLRLPLELLIHPVDCFLGLSQALPSMRKGRKIGFIYDLGFLTYPESYGDSAKSLKQQTSQVIRRSDEIITISDWSKKEILHTYQIPEDKVHVCYPGVNSQFTKKSKIMKKEYPYVLFVGSLWKGKNIPALITAFHQFIQKTKQPHHLIVAGGDYWMDDDISRCLRKLPMSDRVHLVGHVSDEILAQYYRGAVAFVTMTVTEGFCIPIIEANATGCPVIASDIGPIREIEGTAALYVDPKDTDGCAKALEKVSKDVGLRTHMIEAGLKQEKRYSWNLFASAILDIMNTV